MSTAKYLDRYDREDGDIGSDYVIPCGNVAIFDETVWPIAAAGAASGLSAFQQTTLKKTQVVLIEPLDGPDQSVRAVVSHLASIPEFDLDIDLLLSLATEDPSFTIFLRMTKDPLLVDLGTDEQESCYDQGYGLRLTCPRTGAAPVLKLVKYSTRGLPPGVAGPFTATESDGAAVLASTTLAAAQLNPPSDTESNPPTYRGYVQGLRFRARHTDDQVILEAYLNDTVQAYPILSYTDYQHPIWGDIGQVGYEFLSATAATQPAGTSPETVQGIPLMGCHLFEAETIKALAPARTAQPANLMTYERVASRVIVLVEKHGDAKYNATATGQTKIDTYLDFVYEAEKELIRAEGYYDWLFRETEMVLEEDRDIYELPQDVGLLEFIEPLSWTGPPLYEMEQNEYRRRVSANTASGGAGQSGRPQVFVQTQRDVNNRMTIRMFPVPNEELTVRLGYYARMLIPHNPEYQLPFCPQEDIDVLVYAATAHALLLDSDPQNAAAFEGKYQAKLNSLRVKNNRKAGTRQTVMTHVSDAFSPDARHRIPLLRATQLNNLFF